MATKTEFAVLIALGPVEEICDHQVRDSSHADVATQTRSLGTRAKRIVAVVVQSNRRMTVQKGRTFLEMFPETPPQTKQTNLNPFPRNRYDYSSSPQLSDGNHIQTTSVASNIKCLQQRVCAAILK